MKRLPLIAALCGFLLPALAAEEAPRNVRDPSAIWSTWSGAGQFELRADFLPDYGLEVLGDGRILSDRVFLPVDVRNLGSLSIYAPNGKFQGFVDGRLNLNTDIVLRHGDREVSLHQLAATAFVDYGHPALKLSDGQGRHLLTISHAHVLAEHERGLLTIHNADLVVTATLARLLDLPALEGLPIGMAWLDLNLHIPPDASIDDPNYGRGDLSCTGRPFWPQDDPAYQVDVGLIRIGTVAYQGRNPSNTNLIKVAPSATLKSLALGDAVWIPKFSSRAFYSFNPADQHPYLVWNMYRIVDGRIEQLGTSGVKHAFLTLNQNCAPEIASCPYLNGNVLGPQCEDVYSSGTNDSSSQSGPSLRHHPIRRPVLLDRLVLRSEQHWFPDSHLGQLAQPLAGRRS